MKSANKTAIKWIGRMIRPYSGPIALLALISASISICIVSFAFIARWLIDCAVGDREGTLLAPGAALIALLVVRIILNASQTHLHQWLIGKMDMRIKQHMFSELMKKEWKGFQSYHSGELLNRMTGDCRIVTNALIGLLPKITAMITSLIACLVALASLIDGRLVLLACAFGLVVLAVGRLYGRRSKRLHKALQKTEDAANSFTQENFTHWMLIRSFGGEEATCGGLDARLGNTFRAKMRCVRWSNLSHSALFFLFNGSYFLAMLWGAFQLSAGGMTYGMLTALLQIVNQIRSPFMDMSGIVPQYYNMLASAERIMELEDLPDEPRSALPYTAADLYGRLHSLRAERLSFAYDEDKTVLSDADFTVKKGEFVALAGFSGIGKTTLFKLMMGFYPPASGTLTAQLEDGAIPLNADTRCLFAYVPQNNMLLSGTIRDNIAFCCDNVTDEAIWAAAEVADVAEAIRLQPNGLDTVLGEGGTGLSEGQLQRLAIARAVLSGAPILLLDECTASLDEATEERVLQRLRALPDRTCLCISHRPAALDVCDRTVRVVDGKFIED